MSSNLKLLLLKEKEQKTEITLKGSVAIVSDFFFTAINSILYQRGEKLIVDCCFLGLALR